jgi:aminomethyltransferase
VEILGVSVLLARTGYTGEDGFELFVDNAHAVLLWNYLENVGEDKGLVPCGLASRDSLRLEAGMPLFGHEMDSTTSPFDAGLGGMVRGALKHKGEFFARAGPRGDGRTERACWWA